LRVKFHLYKRHLSYLYFARFLGMHRWIRRSPTCQIQESHEASQYLMCLFWLQLDAVLVSIQCDKTRDVFRVWYRQE
jgi:hypothetical protein